MKSKFAIGLAALTCIVFASTTNVLAGDYFGCSTKCEKEGKCENPGDAFKSHTACAKCIEECVNK
jgi:hypothetical protein